MAFTANYNLKKPEQSEQFDVQHQNSNMDIIDSALTPTANPEQAPTGLSGKLSEWVGWIVNRFKAITGKENWYDTPTKSMEGLNTDLTALQDEVTAHKADYASFIAGSSVDVPLQDGITGSMVAIKRCGYITLRWQILQKSSGVFENNSIIGTVPAKYRPGLTIIDYCSFGGGQEYIGKISVNFSGQIKITVPYGMTATQYIDAAQIIYFPEN